MMSIHQYALSGTYASSHQWCKTCLDVGLRTSASELEGLSNNTVWIRHFIICIFQLSAEVAIIDNEGERNFYDQNQNELSSSILIIISLFLVGLDFQNCPAATQYCKLPEKIKLNHKVSCSIIKTFEFIHNTNIEQVKALLYTPTPYNTC